MYFYLSTILGIIVCVLIHIYVCITGCFKVSFVCITGCLSLIHNTETALLCDRVGSKHSGQPGGIVVVVVVLHGVMLCHIQVHANVSFQSPACPLLLSTWETATVFTLRRDHQGEIFSKAAGVTCDM